MCEGHVPLEETEIPGEITDSRLSGQGGNRSRAVGPGLPSVHEALAFIPDSTYTGYGGAHLS